MKTQAPATVGLNSRHLKAGMQVLLNGTTYTVQSAEVLKDGYTRVTFKSPEPHPYFHGETFRTWPGQVFRVLVSEGTPATFYIGSDAYALTLACIEGVRADGTPRAVVTHGSPCNGERFTLRQNGYYVRQGSPQNSAGHLVIGYAEDKRDPSF